MTYDRKELKAQAKQRMGQTRPHPMLTALVLMAVTILLSVLTMSLNGTFKAYSEFTAAVAAGQTPALPEGEWTGGILGWLLGVALDVMGMELTVGFAIYCLRVWRQEKAGVGDLFDSFGVFFRCIWITILPSALLGLWSMLYVMPVSMLIVLTGHTWWVFAGLPLMIPMLMASYSYRLATYIMLDNPRLSCFACVATSRAVMRGRRWKLFVFDLSFLGWMLLCLIPLVGAVVYIWLTAYANIAEAGFYQQAMRDVMAQAPYTGPMPPEDRQPPVL